MLIDQIRNDLTAAMKDRDQLRTSTLRMCLAAISEEAVAGKAVRDLDDNDVRRVLSQQAKRREEAAEAFRAGGRDDAADKELAEHAVIAAYLPTQMTAEEIEQLVADVITSGEFTSMRDMGAAMREAADRAEGRADGKALSAAVKAALSS